MEKFSEIYIESNESKKQGTNLVKLRVSEILGELEISFENYISKEDAEEISKLIIEENNNNGKHMLEKTSEEIYLQSKNNGCSIARFNNKLIGFMTIMEIGDENIQLFEIGSLIVKEDYRRLGIGKELVNLILTNNLNKFLYAISNSKNAIKAMNSPGKLHEVHKSVVPQNFIEIIESVGDLLHDDVILVNNKIKELL